MARPVASAMKRANLSDRRRDAGLHHHRAGAAREIEQQRVESRAIDRERRRLHSLDDRIRLPSHHGAIDRQESCAKNLGKDAENVEERPDAAAERLADARTIERAALVDDDRMAEPRET